MSGTENTVMTKINQVAAFMDLTFLTLSFILVWFGLSVCVFMYVCVFMHTFYPKMGQVY